ncbi:MAG: FAD binding domain-containing protein [Burkholderiales bacterium]
MYPFNYVKADTLAEAGALLAANPEAKLLAGGMTLIPTMKTRLARPSHLIDIAGLAELAGIGEHGNSLVIGAAVRYREIAASAVVKKTIPALARLAAVIGDPQVRNCGTIGGSVANNDPAADCPAALLALGATVVTTQREIAAEDFFQGMFATALDPAEIVVRLSFPIPKRAAYAKFPHPASGYAMAGVFIAETAAGMRVAVTGAGPGVFRWHEAETALAGNPSASALETLSVAADDLNEDLHAPREYRANLVKVMAQRALDALQDAK